MSDPHPAGHDEAALTEGLGSANKTTTLSLSKTKVKKPALYTTKGRSAAGDFSALWYQDWLVQTCASIGQIIQAHGEDTPTVHVDKGVDKIENITVVAILADDGGTYTTMGKWPLLQRDVEKALKQKRLPGNWDDANHLLFATYFLHMNIRFVVIPRDHVKPALRCAKKGSDYFILASCPERHLPEMKAHCSKHGNVYSSLMDDIPDGPSNPEAALPVRMQLKTQTYDPDLGAVEVRLSTKPYPGAVFKVYGAGNGFCNGQYKRTGKFDGKPSFSRVDKQGNKVLEGGEPIEIIQDNGLWIFLVYGQFSFYTNASKTDLPAAEKWKVNQVVAGIRRPAPKIIYF